LLKPELDHVQGTKPAAFLKGRDLKRIRMSPVALLGIYQRGFKIGVTPTVSISDHGGILALLLSKIEK